MKKGINIDNMDLSINPRDNFYEYACGGWKRNHPLRPEFSRYGIFSMLDEEARKNVHELINTLSEDPESKQRGTISQKVSDIFSMGMNMKKRNEDGNKPLIPLLNKAEAFSIEKFAEYTAWLSKGIDSTFFSFGIGADPENSDMNILFILPPALTLGDRDYYLVKSDNNDLIMAAFKQYIIKIMELAGYSHDDAMRIMNTVISIETRYAENMRTKEEDRDPLLSLNIRSLSDLKKDYPNIPFAEIFDIAGIKNIERINITEPSFISFINNFLPTLEIRQIKDLYAYGIVSSSLGVLSDEFGKASFDFFGRVISGAEEEKPLWKRAMAITNSMFGEAIGQLYVRKHFPEENKEYMVHLVENLRTSLANHIKSLKWMSESTKKEALVKLDAMHLKIGYPDKWKDYSAIDIDPEKSYLENVLAASVWYTDENYAKCGEPVDKSKWHMYPQTVNAYYSPVNNEICFPAAILQPPFFDINSDDALNYGSIGVIIGHEMTHGFDDSGRKFDSEGNLNNWWNTEDEKEFNILAEKLEKQYDEVEVAPGVHANGKFTLGENIADQGGLRIALTAYQSTQGFDKDKEISGFNSFQRFYLANALVWAQNIRPEAILTLTQNDSHSLPVNRVNVAFKNLSEFIEAFQINEGDKMWLPEEERVIIW